MPKVSCMDTQRPQKSRCVALGCPLEAEAFGFSISAWEVFKPTVITQ